MGEDASAIEREIRERRAQLDSTVDALEARAARAMDWQQRFQENPNAGLALAFGVGLIASGMLSGDSEPDGRGRRDNGRTNGMLSSVKSALLGMAAVELRRFVRQQFASGGGTAREANRAA